MNKEQAIKSEVEHMENRTQWHKKDVERMEALRNELTALQNDGKISDEARAKNKVVHHH
jgi:hypothetical protein